MATASSDQLRQLLKDPDNSRCFDCNRPGTQWASVSHGIYVCLECSGQHRGLGVHISFVKSITMDAWYSLSRTPTQLRMMICGGNKRLKEFFRSYQFPVTMSLQTRYSTKAALFYRAMLKAEAEGKQLEAVPPNLETGMELAEGTDHLFRPKQQAQTGFGSEEPKQDSSQSGGWWSSARSAFSGAVSKASDITSSVPSIQTMGRVREADILGTLHTAASSVIDTSKVLGSALIEKSKEVAQSDSMKSVTSKIGQMGQRAYEGASQAIGRMAGGPEEVQEDGDTLEELVRRDRERAEREDSSTGDRFDPLQATRPLAGERSGQKTDKLE